MGKVSGGNPSWTPCVMDVPNYVWNFFTAAQRTCVRAREERAIEREIGAVHRVYTCPNTCGCHEGQDVPPPSGRPLIFLPILGMDASVSGFPLSRIFLSGGGGGGGI